MRGSVGSREGEREEGGRKRGSVGSREGGGEGESVGSREGGKEEGSVGGKEGGGREGSVGGREGCGQEGRQHPELREVGGVSGIMETLLSPRRCPAVCPSE